MKKRILCAVLCLVLLLGLFPVSAGAETVVTFSLLDGFIYNGGIFDAAVHVNGNPSGVKYQWQVDVSMGEGSWVDLEDDSSPSSGYHGTKTSHFQLITSHRDGSLETETGWNRIPFRCKVTVGSKTYYSQPFTMSFYKTTAFDAQIKKGFQEGTLGISTRTFRGVSNQKVVSESGFDTVYSGKAVAGEAIGLWMGVKEIGYNTMLWQSDARLIPEIAVTESGKTTRYTGKQDNFIDYTTSTVGTNAVKIEYKVRLKHGVNDLGYYQTETMNVSTSAPNLLTTAIAKYDCSVLKERYNESEKLVNVPKNAEVGIIENLGGTWYKVLYKNRIGYIPTSALTETQIINSVRANVRDPEIGKTASFGATAGDSRYTIHSVDWYDKTADRFLIAGDTFQKGHQYQVVVWLQTNAGYAFPVNMNGNPALSASVNNYAVTPAVAYEQDPEKVIELRYDYPVLSDVHVCSVTRVEAVAPTCLGTGFKAYYHCSCGKNYEDAAAKKPIANLTSWGTVAAKGHGAGVWRYNSTHHYLKCPDCLEIIPGSDAPHTGGVATCMQRAVCEVCGQSYGEIGTHDWTAFWVYQDEFGHAYACNWDRCNAYDTRYPHVPGPAATETEPQLCTECAYVIAPAKNHRHNLTKVEAKDATCFDPGNTEYYSCSGCADIFKDEKGTEKLDRTSVITAPLGHMIGDDWCYDEDFHWRECTRCAAALDETMMEHGFIDGTCADCGYQEGGAVNTGSKEPQNPQNPDDPDEKPQDDGSAPDLTWLWIVLVFGGCFILGGGAVIVFWLIRRQKKGNEAE